MNEYHREVFDFSGVNSNLTHAKYLKSLSIKDLQSLAENLKIININALLKHELIFIILKKISESGETLHGEGVLEILSDGFGFLRSMENNYAPSADDIYVSPNQIRRFGLRTGDTIECQIRAPKTGEKYFALFKVSKVNFEDAQKTTHKTHFDNLVPIYPIDKIKLEVENNKYGPSTRVVDIVSPIGKGQRGLIVAPAKAGKTRLMQHIANSITTNHPEIYLIVLLVGERPEEVTDMRRLVDAEVISSTFDEPATRHTQIAEIVIEKAKRLVEYKKDVLILLDSLTRLARAYNTTLPSSGKVLTGGLDANAIHQPKRLFGAARNIEEGGSLTIMATVLYDTGSRMDDVIYEEFKGTGNSEIHLDRRMSDKRVFPAIDVTKSGTRKEEALVDSRTHSCMNALRNYLMNQYLNNEEIMIFLLNELKKSLNNKTLFENMLGTTTC